MPRAKCRSPHRNSLLEPIFITATYGGSDTYAASTAPALTQVVNTPPPPIGCKVVYTVQNQWNVGFTAAFTIQNTGTATINPWTLTFAWPGNQQITQSWNGDYTQSGASATIKAASWNKQINPGQTLTGMGFNASYSGTNNTPTAFYVNGVLCN